MPQIYLNGKLVDKADAKISVYDHGLLYGDGVFEGIRVYNGKIFRCREHVLRLYESARAIKLEIPLTIEQMIEAMGLEPKLEAILAADPAGHPAEIPAAQPAAR